MSRIFQMFFSQADLAQKQEPLTATRIKNKLFGLDEKPLMLLEMYDEHNEKLARSIDHGISKSTHTRHCATRSHLSLFINNKYGITDLTIRGINNAFQDFIRYLYERNPHLWCGGKTADRAGYADLMEPVGINQLKYWSARKMKHSPLQTGKCFFVYTRLA